MALIESELGKAFDSAVSRQTQSNGCALVRRWRHP